MFWLSWIMLLWTWGLQISNWDTDLISFGYCRIAGSYGSYVFNFLRNLHIVFHRDYTNLYSHQHCISVPFSPHPHQHWFISFVFLIMLLNWLTHCQGPSPGQDSLSLPERFFSNWIHTANNKSDAETGTAQALFSDQRIESQEPSSQINFLSQFGWRYQIYRRVKVKGVTSLVTQRESVCL